MIFLEKIKNLREKYVNDSKIRDSAWLYGSFDKTPPIAKHIVFFPMPEDVMREMVENYRRSIPEDLLSIYRCMNGADLFWRVRYIGENKRRIPRCDFSIYGVPLTYDRKHIEPLNICIEDFDRPDEVPVEWLKFGLYYSPDDNVRLDLYVDTDIGKVYAVMHERVGCEVCRTWTTIDDCLCEIVDLLSEA